MSKAKVSGTYFRLPDGREIAVTLKKIKPEDISPPPAIRQGRFIDVEQADGEIVKHFQPVYSATLPRFRSDAELRLLKNLGVEITPELLKYLGYTSYCKCCGEELYEEEALKLGDGTSVCPICYGKATQNGWLEGLPEKEAFTPDMPVIPEEVVMVFANEAVELWNNFASKTPKWVEQEGIIVPINAKVPDRLMEEWRGIAVKKLHGLMEIATRGLQEMPLNSPGGYSRAKQTRDGDIIPDMLSKGNVVNTDGWRDWLVKGVDSETGEEDLEEFPYFRKTHFIDANATTMKPSIYWPQFQVLDKGSFREMAAKDDSGRHALWNFAQECMSGKYTFPDGTNGEVMIVNAGYHATSGTKQEYFLLARPIIYMTEEGERKFVWLVKTCQTSIKFSKGMPIPKKGEKPTTVAAKQTLQTQKFEDMISGLIKV